MIHTHDPGAARRVFEELAGEWGLRRSGRVYCCLGPFALDLVGFFYAHRTRELRFCGFSLLVQSPEDAVVSSLNACVLGVARWLWGRVCARCVAGWAGSRLLV